MREIKTLIGQLDFELKKAIPIRFDDVNEMVHYTFKNDM
jgi:hypothetical protein